jgi:hypothetical protein
MRKTGLLIFLGVFFLPALAPRWGFFGHRLINRMAVFTLPPEMIGFYKKHIAYIEEAAVNPDRRRYAVPDEGPRHYIDLESYGDSAAWKLPRYEREARAQLTDDTLLAHGVLPWNLARVHAQLRDAFMVRDVPRILRLSADLGHYVADAHVPLHNTRNYDGQLTGQAGIHALWESRLPELFADRYTFWVGRAEYVPRVQLRAWDIVQRTHLLVDSVLRLEKEVFRVKGDEKFGYETRGRQTARVVTPAYAAAYHEALNGMVERQMRRSVKTLGDFWYTAWVDAGQPDLKALMHYTPTEEELRRRREELAQWKAKRFGARAHEVD